MSLHLYRQKWCRKVESTGVELATYFLGDRELDGVLMLGELVRSIALQIAGNEAKMS